MSDGLDLFNQPEPEEEEILVPPPPTGPAAEPYTEEDGRPPAFFRFLASDEGKMFWLSLQIEAREALMNGEKRFSVLGFIHDYRHRHKVEINNTFAPWFADMLVGHHPQLLEIVERRKRKKKGPFV